jgi:predicted O-methyltransferase YrrM
MNSTDLGDPALERLLARLHAESRAQEEAVAAYLESRKAEIHWGQLDEPARRYLADKLVALDPDKSLFCHRLCLALRARRVVEVGTSHGVSTLYLAQAMKRLESAEGTHGVVLGTEYEADKARAARANFKAAGLADYIDLREGDLRQTLKHLEGPVDFVLMDIWEMARAAIELIAPHLRAGAVIITDNTGAFPENYTEYFEFVLDPVNAFSTQTLPFSGGLEFTVKL